MITLMPSLRSYVVRRIQLIAATLFLIAAPRRIGMLMMAATRRPRKPIVILRLCISLFRLIQALVMPTSWGCGRCESGCTWRALRGESDGVLLLLLDLNVILGDAIAVLIGACERWLVAGDTLQVNFVWSVQVLLPILLALCYETVFSSAPHCS